MLTPYLSRTWLTLNVPAGSDGPALTSTCAFAIDAQPLGSLKTAENVAFGLEIRKRPKEEIRRKVNELLAKQADGKKVRLIDLNDKYLEKKDELLKELQQVKDPHLLTTHYRLWADGIQKPLAEMLH